MLTKATKAKAIRCQLSRTWHRPRPLRYVLHHIQPKTCGGPSVPANLANLCDNCHYTVHAIMAALRDGDGSAARRMGNRAQRRLAWEGYRRCLVAGTVARIPDEGHAG